MLEKYPKSIKIGALINLIISALGIIWGIFESEEWPFLIFGSSIAVTLILFFISKFAYGKPKIKPIYDGLFWGVTIPAILLGLILAGYSITQGLSDGGGSNDMGGLSGIILMIMLIIASVIIFIVSLLIGVLIAYKNSKNRIVLVIAIALTLLLMIFLYYTFLAINSNINPFGWF